MTTNMLPSDVVRVASLYFEGLDTPMSLALSIMLRYGEWDEISDVNPDPRDYLDHEGPRYAADAAAAGLLRKLAQLPTTHDRRGNALAKWQEGESDCKRTNFRLEPYLCDSLFPEERIQVIADVFNDARQVVLELIGDRPPDLLEGKFGPGATYFDRGGMSTIPDKMASDPSLTPNALFYHVEWSGTQWAAAVAARSGKVSMIPGNRFTTVAKTCKTDRGIAIEPSINVFYQLAVGTALRKRLKRRVGWDLERAQEIHRQVACESSRTREFATLDLSNASDTVARNLVKLLLPRRWYEVLADLRSPKTRVDGRWVVLEKFSSMGNGFTFELETIIFAALSCAVSRRFGHAGRMGVDVYTYGDDIIIKTDVARALKSVLEFSGFKLNAEKSYFGDEPFRESCGGDYFAGRPARPYFLKELPNEPQEYIAFANGINAVCENLDPFRGHLTRRAWFSVLDNLPSSIRACRGPKALGDLVVHDAQNYWQCRTRNSIRYLRVYRPARWRRVNVHGFTNGVVLACATYGVGTPHPKGWAFSDSGGVIPRGGVLGYKVGWVTFS